MGPDPKSGGGAPQDQEGAGGNLVELQERLGHRFHDPTVLNTALTHRSYAHEAGLENGSGIEHYERLEFLGDALLGFLTARLLFELDPSASEGVLTRRKQMVVRTGSLADTARRLGLGEAMCLGKGERASGGGQKASLLADVFESVLAAVYLDGGYEQAASFVRRHLGGSLHEATGSTQVEEDYKTRFQEQVQRRIKVTPVYRIVSRTGPDHRQTFLAEVTVREKTAGRGEGSSRKKAEQKAALDALERWEERN